MKAEAARFFKAMLADDNHQPEYFNREDWEQLRVLRNNWLVLFHHFPQRCEHWARRIVRRNPEQGCRLIGRQAAESGAGEPSLRLSRRQRPA